MPDTRRFSANLSPAAHDDLAFIAEHMRFAGTVTSAAELAIEFLARQLRRRLNAETRERGFRLEVLEVDKDDPEKVLRRTEIDLL